MQKICGIIRREGAEELRRSAQSLVWSGVDAGLLFPVSVPDEAILGAHLPKSASNCLIENFGDSIGFMLVLWPDAAFH